MKMAMAGGSARPLGRRVHASACMQAHAQARASAHAHAPAPTRPPSSTPAVLLSGLGSAHAARKQGASALQSVPRHVLGYGGIMGLFIGGAGAAAGCLPCTCVCATACKAASHILPPPPHARTRTCPAAVQETLRGVRSKHDALNSFLAGTLAGGLAAGHFQGGGARGCACVHVPHACRWPGSGVCAGPGAEPRSRHMLSPCSCRTRVS